MTNKLLVLLCITLTTTHLAHGMTSGGAAYTQHATAKDDSIKTTTKELGQCPCIARTAHEHCPKKSACHVICGYPDSAEQTLKDSSICAKCCVYPACICWEMSLNNRASTGCSYRNEEGEHSFTACALTRYISKEHLATHRSSAPHPKDREFNAKAIPEYLCCCGCIASALACGCTLITSPCIVAHELHAYHLHQQVMA